MSRRRGEFEHRTSIFEGAFRAWSHLGGLDPEQLELKPAAELDPLTTPMANDPREAAEAKDKKSEPKNPDGTKRRTYPYEPLPRSGLAHPYVQAILSPWLGPDADHDAIQLGLTTLRTWWQHRRKGESGSAIAALGTDKMRGVVEGYTRHFFNLAHCLVINDKEQPPRTLHGKMKELEKIRNKRNKKRAREEQAGKLAALALNVHGFNPSDPNSAAAAAAAAVSADMPNDSNLSPLERLHAAQRRQLAESGGIHASIPGMGDINSMPLVPLKGKCIPGKIDLPGVVNAVNHHASQLAHRGGNGNGSSFPSGGEQFGDPATTPVVFVSQNGDIQIAMSVDGITCAHCVKIVETVLKGCNGNKSPIEGLVDAAADRVLCKVLVKIDKSSNAKRVAFEAARNLAMVGYNAKPMEMNIVSGDKKTDLLALSAAFDVVATTDPKDVFDWSIPCTCPDNGILREDCSRHSQMNTRIFEAFETRERQVSVYMAGCGQKYGMPCTCGPDCRCSKCSEHCKSSTSTSELISSTQQQLQMLQEQQQQLMACSQAGNDMFDSGMAPMHNEPLKDRVQSRNPSIISFGGNMRHMSITSETTFGRAMSGLSALSIDWENMEDFDINVDHSAHINNNNNTNPMGDSGMNGMTPTNRRSSLRRSMNTDSDMNSNAQVSFQV
eukprot:CAMPEP_0202445184 /NCGR_PEP_ID=MMETSP1360-20130828/4057_1 /ASSEMBLY_ACC=CAM_ASM_000848 /TAXON_ID=515479 /ORGANISM="Licmophora paradoxa, Strain CCMP2313" /LENGTH=665 /DNA_ID=CAMNT_0049061367 /DNA_START=27 /DNA_END=2024 /DNA_ORIENTATION=-